MPDNHTQHSRRSYLRIAGTAGAVSMAGCTLFDGGGDGGELVIGATVPLTGQFSSLGQEVEQGYRLGEALLNEQLDRDVSVVIRDDESNPEQVGTALQSITSNNDVDMLWGSFASPLVTAGSGFAESEELPFLGAFFAFEGAHRTEGYEWTYAPFPKSRDVARSTQGLLELIPEAERPTRIGIWEPGTPWGGEQADRWASTLGDAGFEVVFRDTYQLNPESFSSLISQSVSNDVEVLLSNPTPPGGIQAINEMETNGFSPDVIKFVRGADPAAWWGALGQMGAYVCMCPGWVPGLTGGGNADFRSAYEDEYGLDEGQLIPVAVGGAYNIAQTALQAIDAAGSTAAADVQGALRSETFETVIGSFSFEDNGLPAEGELTAPTGQWWEGGQHTVFPDVDGEGAIDFRFPIPPWSER